MKKKILVFIMICTALTGVFACAAYAEDFDGYLVKFKSPQAMQASEDADIETVNAKENLFKVSAEDAEVLSRNNEDIEYIEPNYLIGTYDAQPDYAAQYDIISLSGELFGTPCDMYYANQWNMPMIKADYLWRTGIDASGVRIGVIDSGDPSRHPDIRRNVTAGRDFTGYGPYDIIGHSTFISGIIAADVNNDIGVAGILSDCEIVPLRIFYDTTKASLDKVIKAIDAAVDEFDCDVINLSLTTSSQIYSLKEAVERAVSKGVIVVAAAGNSADSGIMYPAGYDGVIGVASVDRNKRRYTSSQRNASVDAAAPGASVYSTWLTAYDKGARISYTYKSGTGTSYASPHVAAAAAAAKKLKPDITSDEFLGILADTSEHLGDDGKNIEYGYGLIDIQKITEALGAAPPSAAPSEQPSADNVLIGDFQPNIRFSSDGRAESVSGKAVVLNRGAAAEALVTAAVYDADEDVIFNAETFSENLTTGSTDVVLPEIAVPKECRSPVIKLFVWDTNLAPLSRSFEFEMF